MSVKRIVLCGVMISVMVVLSACGGGGGSSAGGSAPTAPGLNAVANIQSIDLSWTPASGATTYRLYQDPTGSSGFSRVGSDILGTSGFYHLPVSVHLLDWQNSKFQLQACNGDACATSVAISAKDLMLGAIGYVKASNTSANSGFGKSTVISGDGKTLVVGAPEVTDDAEGVFKGERTVVGSGTDTHGAEYVYVLGTDGKWLQSAYLKAPNILDNSGSQIGGFGARFGASVAVSADGKVIAVGAPSEGSAATGINGDQNNNSLTDAGAVYLYTLGADGNWSDPVYIKPSNTRDSQLFGASVVLSKDGSRLAVGSPGEDSTAKGVNGNAALTGNAGSGAVYVFARSSGIWSQKAYLKASNSAASALFGTGLALSGDGSTLAVGAPGEDRSARGVNGDQTAAGLAESGAVYVFSAGATAATWTQQAYIKASNTPAATDSVLSPDFGIQVALADDGNTLAVGGPYVDSDDINQSANVNTKNMGAVYIFKRSATVWVQKDMLKTPQTGTFSYVGSSVALSGDGSLLVTGAPGDSTPAKGINGNTATVGGVDQTGGVFVFALSPAGTGVLKSYVKASNTLGAPFTLWPNFWPQFGATVSLSSDGKTLAVGSPGEYGNGKGVGTGTSSAGADASAPGAGAVYLY